MDPAGPEWDDGDPIAGINPTSADFVDCIHTDGKSLIFPYGTMRALGHMDFYPNGGDTQPGCLTLAGKNKNDAGIRGGGAICSVQMQYFTEDHI